MSAFGFSDSDDVYNALIEAYSESHRAYHTVEHLTACFAHLDNVRSLCESPDEIELALWFHDAVYKPFSSTNEEDSAAWAQKFLRTQGASEDIISRIDSLIMVTKSHGQTISIDELLMVDIDLTILGTSAEIYGTYEKNIRTEYKKVPKFLFNKKRKEILVEFQNQERIFVHDYFHERLEAQARANLTNAIAALQSQKGPFVRVTKKKRRST